MGNSCGARSQTDLIRYIPEVSQVSSRRDHSAPSRGRSTAQYRGRRRSNSYDYGVMQRAAPPSNQNMTVQMGDAGLQAATGGVVMQMDQGGVSMQDRSGTQVRMGQGVMQMTSPSGHTLTLQDARGQSPAPSPSPPPHHGGGYYGRQPCLDPYCPYCRVAPIQQYYQPPQTVIQPVVQVQPVMQPIMQPMPMPTVVQPQPTMYTTTLDGRTIPVVYPK